MLSCIEGSLNMLLQLNKNDYLRISTISLPLFKSSIEAKEDLELFQEQYADLCTASLMKEYLRNIYKLADSATIACIAFEMWCEKAEVSAIHCLKQMAKTIRKHMDGLLAFWEHDGLINASQEGFNNKIGWLTRQAYGYRDETFLHLKIYDLPNLATRKEL